MKLITPRIGALAVTAALTLLNAQAGYCLNPQPLPPRHMPFLMHLLNSLMHLTSFHF